MKDEKMLLQLLQRTSENDDTFSSEHEFGSPVMFVDLGSLTVTDSIDVIVAQPAVIVPRVSERACVPGPEEIQ